MKKAPAPRPTEAELAILRVLWERGPSTVRQVHDILAPARESGYTTTLKFMQLMTEKGMLLREEEGRMHLYRAALPREATQQRLIVDLLERAFGGSSATLVIQALTAKPASAEELREIRKLLDKERRSGAPTGGPQKEKDRE
jgi:predicted transcriptional regulator